MITKTIHTNHKLTSKVKDESFSIDDLQSYNLYLNISAESFEFCAVKNDTNKCILLEEYTFTGINNYNDLENVLKSVWEEHHLLKAGFWKKIKVSFKNQNFNFIPKSLFNKENAKEYLNFTSDFNEENDEIGIYKHISFSGVNVFSYPKNIKKILNNQYPNINLEIVHQNSAIIEATFRGKFTDKENRVLLNVEKNHLTLTLVQNNELIYSNRFYFTSSEDFIYYILLIYKELGLSTENDKLYIYGEISPNSPLYDSIYKYIRHSAFGKRPSFLNFSYHFDEVFDHKFLNTYAIHLCD